MEKSIYRYTYVLVCLALSFMVVFALSSCNSSSSNNTAEESILVNPEGIWLGTQTVLEKDSEANILTDAFDMKTFIYDGRFFGISENANILFAGTYEMGEAGRMIIDGSEDGNQSYKMYTISEDGASWVDGVAVLSFIEKKSFSGRFQNNAYQEGELNSNYSSLYEKGASLGSLAGDYSSASMSITIDDSGHISGSKNSCVINGKISVPNENINIYKLDYTLSGSNGTDDGGNYSGLGIIALDENSNPYFLGLSNNSDDTRMDGVYLSLNDTPLSFTIAQIDNAASKFIGLENGQKVSKKMMAFVDPDNWPPIVSEAMAYVYITIFDNKSKETIIAKSSDHDGSDQRISGMNSLLSSVFVHYTGYQNHYYIEYGNFTDSDFAGMNFEYYYRNTGHYYTHLINIIFDGADMKDVDFSDSQPIVMSYFENTNLEGSNISEANYNPYPDEYLNLYGDCSFNDFSGAWWEDGHRCGIDLGLIPDGTCTDNWIDSGLTYEEWKNGKWEVEKIAENIGGEIKDAADDGLEFVKDTGSSFIKTVSSLW